LKLADDSCSKFAELAHIVEEKSTETLRLLTRRLYPRPGVSMNADGAMLHPSVREIVRQSVYTGIREPVHLLAIARHLVVDIYDELVDARVEVDITI